MTALPETESIKALPDIAADLERALGERFEILQPISIGGMATLFQIRHRLHGGLFVAKLLHARFAHHPGVIAAFRREAWHMARLAGHPSIVPVFDVVMVSVQPCIVMPYVEGEDLDQLLKRQGKLTRDEAMMFAAQIASLLMYAETLGVTHGDLAPGNIRLDAFGQYRLLDFGLSRSTETEQQEQLSTAGTPAYNSPEQIRGEVPDIRSDLYSLGVVLAEVLTGTPLFQAPNLETLSAKHLRGDWILPDELKGDTAMAALLHRLIVADRDQRMSSAFELSGAIAALGYELPSFSHALHPSPQPLRPPKPRRRRLEAI